jgi:Tfp pilus assembly protein PilX
MMSNLRKSQRGVAALAVSMLLLFGTTIVVFYLNRGLLFEQKTSANQARSTAAFEAAEAGLEWATGKLNRPYDMLPNCNDDLSGGTNISFRRKYVQSAWNAASSPTANVVVASPILPIGCYLDSTGQPQCSCPDVTATASTLLNPPSASPAYTVSFASVAGDPLSVQVTSVGCSAATGPCTSATAGSSDATATVRAILKFRRILRAAPAAALTCGTSCGLGGSFNVVNYDSSTNGITVDAGTTTSGTSGAIGTVPGIPPENSVIANDSSLNGLSTADPTCSNDKMFGAYFGSTVAEFAASPATKQVTSKSDFLAQVALGWRSFYFPSGADLKGTAFNAGTQNDPVTIVVAGGNFEVNSHSVIYGLIFSDNAAAGSIGTGSSQIYGAVVACNAFTSNGNGAIAYDGLALTNVQLNTATMVRVPGSWRDF